MMRDFRCPGCPMMRVYILQCICTDTYFVAFQLALTYHFANQFSTFSFRFDCVSVFVCIHASICVFIITLSSSLHDWASLSIFRFPTISHFDTRTIFVFISSIEPLYMCSICTYCSSFQFQRSSSSSSSSRVYCYWACAWGCVCASVDFVFEPNKTDDWFIGVAGFEWLHNKFIFNGCYMLQ